MRRREFTVGLVAAAWPMVARAQQGERMRKIAVLMNIAPGDPNAQENVATFLQMLRRLGWAEGRNVRIEVRWAGGDAAEVRKHASELVATAPDVIVSTGTAGMGPLMQATRTLPIVFANVADPVGAGYIESMARPGGNATGFLQFEYSLSGRWLGLLKEIAPQVTRIAVLRDADISSGIGQFAVIQSVAPSLGIEVRAISLRRDPGEIERGVTAFARLPNGGLILTASALSTVHRNLIIALAARHRLPTVYYRRYFATIGGLVSYGYDDATQYRGAASYVDRILRGENPANLPVQAPSKYELVLNLKTARALGLVIPETLLATADELIQ
jgi:putative tryptophan/tyrosine transport system substrate-binding protein